MLYSHSSMKLFGLVCVEYSTSFTVHVCSYNIILIIIIKLYYNNYTK